ncbi:hypothetical protein FE257_006072 [Aspergillus nanangensis]|uniref:Rhamnogalacturonase A/B/Epimerase-like pectate lyase domain-containing protein n=1 Tax=Aspergillus nanangensis TaxID=2582783 RepID=A0AAD4CPL5_ASPNN|nr:hypothetical protein FE257_006072 [Aspergillus nanangensis]
MVSHTSLTLLVAQLFFFLGLVHAVPTPQLDVTADVAAAPASGYWPGTIKRQGIVAFGNGTDYKVYRNVVDYGAKGDGSTDDTAAINKAISDGNRCGKGCDSSTVTPAYVFFPPGTYKVSKPIIQYYYTQMVGDALDLPVIKAAPEFAGMAVIDADPYSDDGSNWYTNQNNFFRSIRNFVIDLTAMPQGSGAGIHWQVGQATSLQNIRFEMIKGGGDANKQQGIFMDNGSGGFMSDLTFNGGNYGMFLGNQQFTTRNLVFNDCNTAIFMNWNWAWTFKSLEINNCNLGLNMSNSPQNQTVGSILILDSTFKNTPTGVETAFTKDSIPVGGGALILDNVDFSGSKVAVAGVTGNTILPGGSVVKNWVQGNSYIPSSAVQKRDEEVEYEVEVITVTETVEVCTPDYTAPATAPASVSTSALRQGPQADTGKPEPMTSIIFPTPIESLSQPGFEIPGTQPVQSGASQATGVPTNTKPIATQVPLEPTAPAQTNGPAETPIVPIQPSHTAQASTSPAVHGAAGNCASKAVTKTRLQKALPAPTKPSVLTAGDGAVFERSKPLYESYAVSSFISVRSAGAKGDGQTDDTQAIQKVLDSATADQIVYFDHGSYIITDTVKVPKDIKIVGEIWPVLMAHGDKFSHEDNPIPMLQIGQPGDKGSVEISDITIQTKGPAPGAILMEWNVASATQGSVAMWDVHFRIGGSAGTELQSDKCSKTPEQTITTPNPECIAAFMLLHITAKADAYVENAWFWTADHELDLPDHNQINIYTGRGVYIESQGAVWMYGTASEHHQLYNYQVTNARNVFMGMIQTETPYYQANPNALKPFTSQKKWNDPDFANCKTDGCRKAWGVRVMNTSDLYIYGAGLYSFFENYGQTCLQTESCQENMVEVDCSDVHIYGLSTKASVNMITSSDGTALVPQKENRSNFCSTIALFEQT